MYHDSVTGLPTRESFLEFAEKMWKASKPDRFAILSVNIGSFRGVNQHYGYIQGDVLLSLFAQKLVRNNSYVLSACREKADIFLLLLDMNEVRLSEAKNFISDIFAGFVEQISLLYRDTPLSFQIGVCLLSAGIHSILEGVEHAVFARKSLEPSMPEHFGTNIAFYQESLLGSNQCENRILPLFEDIMTANHLILYLQPKFDLDNNSTIGAEALVRIMDNNGKLLKPGVFLPVLEKYGLAYELDLLVMESILKLINRWRSINMEPIPVSINLSEKDFSNPSFMQIFDELNDKYTDAMQYLEFEISESSLSHNPDYMLEAIQAIHAYDCKICLDGFGKEILSINTLGIPPVDTVKFDRSVLSTSMCNEQNVYVLKKLAEMFEDCNIPVICEGIEIIQEEHFIRQCGIHYVQGYYYGRPVPLDLFEKKYMIYEYSFRQNIW